MSNLLGVLEQYANLASANTGNAAHDFDQVSQTASQSHLAGGLAAAFRSSETPPFAHMLSTLFSNSDSQQRAGILNRLLSSVGPAIGSSFLGNLPSGASQVSPEQAQQVPPDAVRQLAESAQQKNPSIIEEASNFYAQHPTLVKALGAGSLAFIMSHMSHNF